LKALTIGTLLVALTLSTNAALIFDAAQNRMEELNEQFNEIMTETLGFLDHAWDIAKKFQDPNYDYDPSELANYTTTKSHRLPPIKAEPYLQPLFYNITAKSYSNPNRGRYHHNLFSLCRDGNS